MESILKADIFFVIASVAVVLVSIALLALLIYCIRIFRNIARISDRAKIESENLAEDIEEFRAEIKRDGMRLKRVISFVLRMLKHGRKG